MSYKNQKHGVSRRRFLSLLSAIGLSTAATACGSQTTQSETITVEPTATVPVTSDSSSSFQGYSIFHETMVDMPWPEVDKAAKDGALVLLPVGVIEEHGPHIGLGADTYQAYLWSQLARKALTAKDIQSIVAPAFYWGMNVNTGSIPGSFRVRPETMKALFYDIHDSLQQWGFKHVFSFNLHGDATHELTMQMAIDKVNKELEIKAYRAMFPILTLPGLGFLSGDLHAGALETAFMAFNFPEQTNTELAKTLEPHYAFTPPGYYGDPAQYEEFDLDGFEAWQEEIGKETAVWIEAALKENTIATT